MVFSEGQHHLLLQLLPLLRISQPFYAITLKATQLDSSWHPKVWLVLVSEEHSLVQQSVEHQREVQEGEVHQREVQEGEVHQGVGHQDDHGFLVHEEQGAVAYQALMGQEEVVELLEVHLVLV